MSAHRMGKLYRRPWRAGRGRQAWGFGTSSRRRLESLECRNLFVLEECGEIWNRYQEEAAFRDDADWLLPQLL